MPPDPVTGVNAVAAWFMVRAVEAIVCAAATSGLTTCVSDWFMVLAALLLSPLYCAVMVWLLALSDDVVKVAWPELSGAAGVCGLLSMLKVTLPVGKYPVTAAVNVTDWPKSDGFSDDDTDVVVESCTIVPLLAAVAVCCGLPLSVTSMV